MKSICIKTNNSKLLNYLLRELQCLEIKNVCFNEKKFKHYENIIVHYAGKEQEEFYSSLSTILSFLVIDELEEEFIKRIIIQNYFYFDINERKKILAICYELFAEDLANLFNKKFNALYNDFFKYISSHKSLVLSGVINFRIQNYFKVLDEIIAEAVNAFIIEKEYLEFISLLKLYINSQPALTEVVHIVYSSSDSIMLDKDMRVIEDDRVVFDVKYLSDISFSANDYTLNSLLNLLPKKIYIHLLEEYPDEFVNTIQTIFENRVSICRDCNICSMYKHQKRLFFKKGFTKYK